MQMTPKPVRIISITGGKGGIGKTTISVNLAVAFAKLKKKVLLFDADLGLANVDVMLGLNPEKNINDFLSGTCDMKDICVEGPHGIKIVPSCSGIQRMADLSLEESVEIIRSFSTIGEDFDVMLVDMASGISKQVNNFTHASQDVVVVICNEPASLTDSYAVIKVLHQNYGRQRFGIVVNKTKGIIEGYDIFSRFQDTVAKFINVSLNYLGHIPQDDYIGIAARERVTVVDKFPHSEVATSFHNLANGIQHWHDESQITGGIQFFFEKLIQVS